MMINKIAIEKDMALNLIDLDRYPIENLDSDKGAEFLRSCQEHMEANGWCSFDQFINADALAALTAETNELLNSAEKLTIKRTIYQKEADSSATGEDIRDQELVHHATQLANDQIPSESLLQQLYQSDLLTDFVRRVQGKEVLYRCADEFQALNVVALLPDNWHAWHYDTTECTVTMLLQAADSGGEFVFLPNSRTDDWEDREAVERLLSGDKSKAESFGRGAGTFTMFRGGYSLHGVTKVEGKQPRVTAILTYDEEPNRILSDEVNIRIYGDRVEKILAERKKSAS